MCPLIQNEKKVVVVINSFKSVIFVFNILCVKESLNLSFIKFLFISSCVSEHRYRFHY
jgi:hypothetical protein